MASSRSLLQLGGLNYNLQSPVVMFLLVIGCITMGLPALAYVGALPPPPAASSALTTRPAQCGR